jgi:hypothetical protein
MSEHLNRPDLLAQMTLPTQAVAQYVESALGGEKRQGLLIRHDIGSRSKQAVEEKATYGCQAVQQIAEYVGMSADRLYKLCSYAESYSREQLEQWAERQMSNGGRLSYNHLTTILIVKYAMERLRLVERVFEESLSVRALRLIIDRQRDATPNAAVAKKTILYGLDQMISRGKGLLNRFPAWRQSVFNEIDKPNRQTINPLVRSRIVEAQLVLEELSAEVATARNNLARSLARVDQLLG